MKATLSRDSDRAPEVAPTRPGTDLELQADDTSRILAAPPWLHRAGQTSWYLICVVVAIVGFLWLMAAMKFIVVPLILSVVLAVLFDPAVRFMARHKINRGAGSAIVVFALVGVGVFLGVFLAQSVVRSLPAIDESVRSAASAVQAWLADVGFDPSQAESATTSAIDGVGKAVGIIVSGVISGLGALMGLLIGAFLALFILLFLLSDLPRFEQATVDAMPLPEQAAATVIDAFTASIRGYYKAVTLVGLVNAVVIAIVAIVLGVPLAGAIAVITFVTSYIPFFGAFIAGGVAAIIAFGSGGWVPALIMVVVSILYNNVASNIIQPLASGRTLNLHPLVVLIVTTAGGVLFGILGAMLAAPITGGIVTVRRDFKMARERGAENEGSTHADVTAPAAPA